jgi:signal transduction histidine kinase/ligand-binding sensor domain-containing protein
MRWSCWVGGLVWALVGLSASASEPAEPADELTFERRRWTLADGAPGQSFDIQQTEDGLMWFASPAGVYSFDGIKFRQEKQIYGHKLLSINTASIHAHDNGSVAVGYTFGGISIMSRRGVQHYVAGTDFPLGSTKSINVDADGTWYAGTTTSVVRLQNDKWVPVARTALPGMLDYMRFDADGALWAFTADEIYVLPKGAKDFRFVMKYQGRGAANFFQRRMHIKLADGSFVGMLADGRSVPLKLENAQAYRSIMNGPNGTVVALRANGLARMAQRDDDTWYETEYYPPVYGAGGVGVSLINDREGNLWRTTLEGVEKYRLHRFHWVRKSDHSWLAQAGMGDELWMGGYNNPLLRVSPDGASRPTSMKAPSALLRMAPDHVWVGTMGGVWEFSIGGERFWELPAQVGKAFEVQALAQDADGKLLVSVVRHGLWSLEQGRWRQDQRLQGLKDPTPISMLRDSTGQVWLGLTNNRLGRLTSQALVLLPAASRLAIGNVRVLTDVGGHLLVGGDAGVAWVHGNQVRNMRFHQADLIQQVSGIVQDRLGQLWIHGSNGLVLVAPKALQAFWDAPDTPLVSELFNFEDGVNGIAAPLRPLPSLSVDSRGRVYYATMSQVGWIDPANIRRNPRAPDVLIQNLRVGQDDFRPTAGLQLPQYTTAIDLSFTATSLSVPERVRLKYRLDGVDPDWREVTGERSAHYTNLRPGPYHFQVIAANEDGVWNLQGAALRFAIQPAFWQTTWFQLLCTVLLILGVGLLYRWRIAIVRLRALALAEARAGARLEATLQERGRIARSLHDNLLQAAQTLILRFHTLNERMPQEPDLQSKLDKVLDYAEQLVASTRDEVVALRRMPTCDELFAELQAAVSATAAGAEVAMTFVTSGEVRPLQDDAAGEIAYVLREAVCNSARHARASRIDVALHYGALALEGAVLDDGVGLGQQPAAAGHWGIIGMRERIQRLGGAIDIGPGAQGGVSVRFSIPAALAYGPGGGHATS